MFFTYIPELGRIVMYVCSIFLNGERNPLFSRKVCIINHLGLGALQYVDIECFHHYCQNCALNKSIAQVRCCQFIQFTSHWFILAVKDIIGLHWELIDVRKITIVKRSFPVCHRKLSKFTNLSPIKLNEPFLFSIKLTVCNNTSISDQVLPAWQFLISTNCYSLANMITKSISPWINWNNLTFLQYRYSVRIF